jgi:glycosidase
MQWDASEHGGFTSGVPWLPAVDPRERNVADQERDPSSILSLYRRLIQLRRELRGELELLDAAPGVLAFRRGADVVAINTTPEPAPAPAVRELVLETEPRALERGSLAPHTGVIARAPE